MSNCGLLYIIICNEVNNLKRNGSLLSEFSQSIVNDKLSSSDNYTNYEVPVASFASKRGHVTRKFVLISHFR